LSELLHELKELIEGDQKRLRTIVTQEDLTNYMFEMLDAVSISVDRHMPKSTKVRGPLIDSIRQIGSFFQEYGKDKSPAEIAKQVAINRAEFLKPILEQIDESTDRKD